MLHKLFFVLGFLWCFPVSFLAWLWLIGMRLTGQISRVIFREDLSFIWDVNEKSKFYKKMEGWYGFTIGNNIICADRAKRSPKLMVHETAHVYQNYILGVFFFPVYIVVSIYMYLFIPNSHPYIDNFLEKSARKFAGQDETIFKGRREIYMKDRWPWW